MREGVPESWLEALLQTKHDVAFVLVFPPHVAHFAKVDPRLQQITCPLRGEVIQRVTALLNANGRYILSINCDEYLHPDIVAITKDYFATFPDSYFFRLKSTYISYQSTHATEPWGEVPPIAEITIRDPHREDLYSDAEKAVTMREIPIAPLANKIDFWALLRGRRDHHGLHQENFDKKVWRNELVQEALQGVTGTFSLAGPFKYIPFWTADRLLGLSVQAHFYEEGRRMGHWLPSPEQLRTEENPPAFPRYNRRYVLAEIGILRQFPRFGYIWNLAVMNRGGIFTVWFPRDWLLLQLERFGFVKLWRSTRRLLSRVRAAIFSD